MSAADRTASDEALVIGYGSDLRTDDAAGRRAAEAVGALGLTGVRVRTMHQLTPELAAELSGYRLVVFVDAAVDVDVVAVRRLRVGGAGKRAAADGQVISHHLDPQGLLDLASLLGDGPGEAVTVSVPAVDLRLGDELTAATRAAVGEAVARVVTLIEGR